MKENILLRSLAEGDEQAFSKVFDLYWEDLFRYIVHVLGDKEESVDIVQETFTALWIQRQQLSHVQSLKAYLFSIARYKAIKWIQQHAQRKDFFESLTDFLNPVSDFEGSLHANELALFIDKEIANLPPKMREVFIMSRVEQLSHKEIAEKLSISDKTVKKQIGYSIKYLRLKVSEQYLSSILLLWFLIDK